jgi:STE24 endopeptidase
VANEDKATRYQRLRRRTTVVGVLSVALVLSLAHLAGSLGWMAVREGAGLLAQFTFLTQAAFSVIAMAVGAMFPATFYRDSLLTRRYGLLHEPPVEWVKDWAKHAAANLCIGTVAVVACALAGWLTPRWWWAVCGIATAVAPMTAENLVTMAMRGTSPGTPIAKGALRDRLVRLLAKAGLPDIGLYQAYVSQRTRLANAMVVSKGRKRHVVISDTLLADYTDEEVEVVVAHELAHIVHHDVVVSQAALALHASVSLLGAGTLLHWVGMARVILAPAELPVALLTAGLVFIALRPLPLAISRLHERRADRYAVHLTGNRSAIVSVLRRMAANNLAEPVPSRLSVWLFHSHPAASKRMNCVDERGR